MVECVYYTANRRSAMEALIDWVRHVMEASKQELSDLEAEEKFESLLNERECG